MKIRGLILFLCALSTWVRFRLADLTHWGVDEAANLWLASRILKGDIEPLGLMSSIGIRNLAGVPLLGIPFTFLPDLLSISRALSIMQLAVLAFLGFFLGRRTGERAVSTCVLLFFPSMILVSFSLWNQYLLLPISATNLALLLFLLRGRGGAMLRALVASAVVALALLMPAVHLMGFADLAVDLLLLCAVLTFRPRPFSVATATVCMLFVGPSAAVLYAPWIRVTFVNWGGPWSLLFFFVAILVVTTGAGILLFRGHSPRDILDRILEGCGYSRVLSWTILAVLLISLAACAFPSLLGAQLGHKLLVAGDPFGMAILAVQAMFALSLLPILFILVRECRKGLSCRDLILRFFPTHFPAATLLLVNASLLLIGRLVLNRTILTPFGRCDLLVSLVPALLAPLILLVQETSRARLRTACVAAVSITVPVLLCFALLGPSRAFWVRFPRFVPPSEMREAVDTVAILHRENSGGDMIDLGYDLEHGREWIVEKVTRFPGFRWYSIGRPYDWLLLRRHGLVNAHEGAIDRRGGNGFQLGYVCDNTPSPNMQVIIELEHLQIRQRQRDSDATGR